MCKVDRDGGLAYLLKRQQRSEKALAFVQLVGSLSAVA